MNSESIKRELHYGNNKKLAAAFQYLLRMGYSVDDACAILADYKEQAADEAEYIDEVEQAFNRHLKNIAAGRYEREAIDGHLYYLPEEANDEDATDAFNDFLDHLEDIYDEYDDEEEAQLYLQFREPLYEALNELLSKGVYDICRVKLNDHDLGDVIRYAADALSMQFEDEECLKEAVELCDFVIHNFHFDADDEYENDLLLDLYGSETDSLNTLEEYEKCDAVLDEMEKYTSRGEALDHRLTLMMDRDEKEMERARQIAIDTLHDGEFIDHDESSGQFLHAASYVFDELDDEEHLQEVNDILIEKGLPEYSDEDPFSNEFMISTALSVIDQALAGDNAPHVQKVKEEMLEMGFSMEEIRIALASVLLRGLKAGEEEEDAEEEALDWFDDEDYDDIEEAVQDGELKRLEEFTEHDEDIEEDHKSLAAYLIKTREEFAGVINEYIKVSGTNSFKAIDDLMWDDLVDFGGFLMDCADALYDTEHYQECLDFIQFILGSFDFSDDDSSTEDILKEMVVESLDGLDKHKEADQYIDAWMKEKPQSTRPVWAKLISLDDRDEKEKAIRLADQVMKMDLEEGDDTDVLLEKVAEIYEEYGEQERLQKAHEKMDALDVFYF